jgi:two-component sensor histidine kinase
MQELQRTSIRGNRVLLLIVAASFVMLLGSSALMLLVSRQSRHADSAVIHTLDVKQAISEIAAEMSGAESGQRGYLLTGDPAFLQPYRSTSASIMQRLSDLQLLVTDNSPQLQRIDSLMPLVDLRLQTIQETIDLAGQGQLAEAARIVRERGLPQTNEIRTRLIEIDRAENSLLIERQRQAASKRQQFISAVGAMLIACAILAALALVSVRRYVGEMMRGGERLARYNAELEARVIERTQELARAAEVANSERARAEALLTDVNHRVGNNLALVSSFLTMQQRTVKSPDAVRALSAARARVQTIASAHRKLRLGSDFATVKVSEVLGAVLEDISAGLPPGDLIRIQHRVEPLDISARDAVSLGVLTSELVMNAIKHAFGPGEGGAIEVTFRGESEAGALLEVSDDGVGWNDEIPPKSSHDGLGTKIVDMVARQFGGKLERSARSADSRRPGTCIRIGLVRLQFVEPS